jgi:hypothetical protein
MSKKQVPLSRLLKRANSILQLYSLYNETKLWGALEKDYDFESDFKAYFCNDRRRASQASPNGSEAPRSSWTGEPKSATI